jgi:hypothetical protein
MGVTDQHFRLAFIEHPFQEGMVLGNNGNQVNLVGDGILIQDLKNILSSGECVIP